MKRKASLIIILVVALLLAGCQSAAPAPKANEPAVTQPADSGAYPAPQQAVAAPASGVLYPDPISGDMVSWEAAESMILNGEVTQIQQTQDLKLTLGLKDGRSLLSFTPAADAVDQAIQKCGDLCKGTKVSKQ